MAVQDPLQRFAEPLCVCIPSFQGLPKNPLKDSHKININVILKQLFSLIQIYQHEHRPPKTAESQTSLGYLSIMINGSAF